MMMGYRGSSIAAMVSGYLNGAAARASSTGYGMMGSGAGSIAGVTGSTAGAAGGGWPTGVVIAVAVLAALLLASTFVRLVPTLRRSHLTLTAS